MSEHLVVVGAGQAAAQAIHSSRQLGFDGKITLIGEEAYAPYQRPPLSKKYLAGEFARERLFLRPEKYYEDRDVELKLRTRVEEIVADTRRIRLSDSSVLDYDYLLLATGSRVRKLNVPGAALTGVNYLRTIEDVDSISAELVDGARVVIVGGGYIGLEVAAVCRGRGCQVRILEAADRLLGRVVCEATAVFYANIHHEHGVDIVCNAQVSEFRGDGKVSSVRTLAGDEFPCDCVIVGIGVEPNVSLAKDAGLACDNGISVDASARTEDPRIVAAGDCTSHPHPWVGRRIRLESVHNAIEQSKAAAHSLFGESAVFDEVPWFWSDQYDLKLQIAGLALDYDQTIVRGDTRSKRFAVYYLRNEYIVAIDAVNSPRDFLAGKKLLSDPPKIPLQAIADPGVDLMSFAKPMP